MAQYYTVSTVLSLHIAGKMASKDRGYARVRNVSLSPNLYILIERCWLWCIVGPHCQKEYKV